MDGGELGFGLTIRNAGQGQTVETLMDIWGLQSLLPPLARAPACVQWQAQ